MYGRPKPYIVGLTPYVLILKIEHHTNGILKSNIFIKYSNRNSRSLSVSSLLSADFEILANNEQKVQNVAEI
jgi:hypothetical protein